MAPSNGLVVVFYSIYQTLNGCYFGFHIIRERPFDLDHKVLVNVDDGDGNWDCGDRFKGFGDR